MNRTWIILTVLVAFTLPAAAKQRPASMKSLRDAGLAALKKGDAAAYIHIMFNLADIKKYCPDQLKQLPPGLAKKMHNSIRKSVKKCNALFDWSKAKLVRVEGGEKKKPDKKCKNLFELKDIKAYYAVGKKTYRVKLDDPIVFGGKLFVFADDPRCREERK